MEDLKSLRNRTILIAVFFIAVFSGLLYFSEQKLEELDIQKDGHSKVESINGTHTLLSQKVDKMDKWFYGEINDIVKMMTFLLKDRLVDGEWQGSLFFEDSMVARVQNGKIVTPSNIGDFFTDLQPEAVLTEYEQILMKKTNGEFGYLTSGAIGDGWYYLDWTSSQEHSDFSLSHYSPKKLNQYTADAYGGDFFTVYDDMPEFFAGTDGFSEYSSLAELGLSPADLEKESFPLKTNAAQYVCYPNISAITINHTVYCDKVGDEKASGSQRVITVTLCAAGFLAVLITYYFSVREAIKRSSCDGIGTVKYSPVRMKHRVFIFSVLTGLALSNIMALTAITQESHHETRKGSRILDSLEIQIADNKKSAAASELVEKEWYAYFGEKLSLLIPDDPTILEREKLAEVAQSISADLIMIFDENGEEIACSSEYTGWKLSDAGSEEVPSDFLKLLRGVHGVIQGPAPDFVTGEEHYIIGTPCDLPDSEQHGAILLFIPTSNLIQTDYADWMDLVYMNLATDDEILIDIDPDTYEIRTTSVKKPLLSEIKDLDLFNINEENNSLDIFYMNNNFYYSFVRNTGNAIYYYAAKITDSIRAVGIQSLAIGLVFFIGCLFISNHAMKGYTKGDFNSLLEADAKDHPVPENDWGAPNSSVSPYIAAINQRWNTFTPEKKAGTVLQIVMGVICLLLLAAGFFSKDAVLSFIFTGSWQKGVNPFAVLAIAVILSIGFLIIRIIDIVFIILYHESTTREKTVRKLIHSILKYILIMVLIYNSLNFLGVNTQALIASLGIISLAVSLGAQGFISDILAGLGIVFDGQFQIGQIVEIDGFKGTVEGIGIRSTVIKSIGTNNIKIINNHKVENVINYSRELSRFSVEFDLPVLLPIETIKDYLERELPIIREAIPQIIFGPDFAGITNLDLGMNKMRILIIGRCLEEDVLIITRQIHMMMKERIDQFVDLQKKK